MSKVIRINEDFSVERDSHCWHLHQWRDGKNPRTGEPTRAKRTTYHATLEQVARAVLDRSAGEAESMEELLEVLERTKYEIMEVIGNVKDAR